MWDLLNNAVEQSLARIASAVAIFLPGLLALIVALLIALVVATLVRAALRRSLQRIQFDRLLDQWGFSLLADWSPKHSPTLLVTGIVFWLIVLLGLMVGLSAFDAQLLNELAVRLFTYLPEVLAALVILTVGTFAARFLARGVLISAVNMQIQSARLISLGVKWLVMLLAAAMALEHLGIGGQIVVMAFGILFGGIVFALALAVGLGSKDMVSRSWEKQAERQEDETETFHHL